jgi:hypothetical protein
MAIDLLGVLATHESRIQEGNQPKLDEILERVLLAKNLEPSKQSLFFLREALTSIGHIDSWWENGAWRYRVAPGTLVRLPISGYPTGFIVGLMPTDRRRLGDRAYIVPKSERVEIMGIELPSLELVEAADEPAFIEAATYFNVQCSGRVTAWDLLKKSPSVKDIEAEFTPRNLRPDNEVLLKIVENEGNLSTLRDENPNILPINDSEVELRQSGSHFYLVRNKNGRREATEYVDKYFGQYCALQKYQVLVYSSEDQSMKVPSQWPLPRCMSRVLGLCSGRYPEFQQDVKFPCFERERPGIIYRKVPPRVANVVLEKLGQSVL